MKIRLLLLAGCGLSIIPFTASAQVVQGGVETAQQSLGAADAAGATVDGTDANEIVVTAQNRVQNAQDVPIVMNVINAEQLANAGFSNANDLSKIAPVAQIVQDQGTVKITLRGIGTQANDAGQDTSVVVNIDGEYINRPNALAVSLFDLERVEVLRGPQGTLYGRNSTAGNVNFVVRKPGDKFGADGAVSYGNYDTIRADAGVDVPITEGVGIRLAGFYEDRDGYTQHTPTAAGREGFTPFAFPAYPALRSDDNNAYGGRASIQAREIGGSGLSVYLAGEYSERRFTPQLFGYADTHLARYNPGAQCQNPGWVRAAPLITNQTLCVPQNTTFLSTFDRSRYAPPRNGIGKQFWNTTAVRGRIDYKLSQEATLSYIGGYRYFERDPKSTGSLPVIYGNTLHNDTAKTQSHELRIAGDFDNGIIYQVGGFYFKEVLRTLGGFYLGDITPGSSNFGLYINYNLRNQDSDSKSAFGQIEVPILDTLTAIGGIRYSSNKRSAVYRDKDPRASLNGPRVREPDETITIPATATAPAMTIPILAPARNLNSDDAKVTWLLGLNFKPDTDTLIYAKVSTGFKGGGFDAVAEFDPETNTAYEIGLKKNFGERGQHLFNLTGFRYDYKGLQVNVLLNSAEGGRTFNAGAAKIQGIEAETTISLDSRTNFNATVNFLDSTYKEFFTSFNVYCVPGPTATLERPAGGVGNCATANGLNLTAVGDLDPVTPGIQQSNLAGNPTPFSPRFIVTVGLDHSFDLGSAGKLTARANTTFKTRYYTGPFKQRDSSQAALTQSDVSLEYSTNNGLKVTGFVRNIENTRALSYGAFLAVATDDIWNWQFGTPRTYGVRVAYEF